MRILLRAADLLSRAPEVVRAAAADIDAILAREPITLVPALDRAFRDAGLHAALDLPFLDLRAPDVDRLVRDGAGSSGALGVASLVRDGHAREAAVHRLGARLDRLATAFLINRLNDYVGPIGDLAWSGLQPRLVARHADVVAPSLPLIARMRVWVRAGAERYDRIQEVVRGLAARPVLWDSLRARDLELARSAALVLADLHRGRPELRDVLAAALSRSDQRLRIWAARVAVDPAFTPSAVLQDLAAALERDRNPAIRVLGARARAVRDDRAGLLRAAFDPHGLVRHHARLLLARRSGAVDYRGVALATLADHEAARPALVGALATLSEFGRRDDIPAVAARAADPRPSIAREARRTLGLLQRLP